MMPDSGGTLDLGRGNVSVTQSRISTDDASVTFQNDPHRLVYTNPSGSLRIGILAFTPENNTVGNRGDLIISTGNGRLYYKTTDGSNTGWKAFGEDDSISDGSDSIQVFGTGENRRIRIASNGITASLRFGIAPPEASVIGNVGDMFLDTQAAYLYLKRTGSGDTGWVNVTITNRILDDDDSLTIIGLGDDRRLTLNSNGRSVDIRLGNATPEGTVTGSVGDLFYDSLNSVFYAKKTGIQSTAGWVNLAIHDSISDNDDSVRVIGDGTDRRIEIASNDRTVSVRLHNEAPEGEVIGTIGDLLIDTANGAVYFKETGTNTNSGWMDISETHLPDRLTDSLDSLRLVGTGNDRRIIFTSNRITVNFRISEMAPEGQIFGSVGDILVDTANADIYFKESGTDTNTGWVNVSTSPKIGEGADTVRVFGTGDDRRIDVTSDGATISVRLGTASPEGQVTGNAGDLFLDETNANIYMKRTGTGNAGWVSITDTARIFDGSDFVRVMGTGEDRRVIFTSNNQTIVLRLSTGTPEGAVAGLRGDIYIDKLTGNLWSKASISGNTGWRNVSVSDRIEDADDSVTVVGTGTDRHVNIASNDVTTKLRLGTGNPEGTVTGDIGDLFINTADGTIWIKRTTNDDNTGWDDLGDTPTASEIEDGNDHIRVIGSGDDHRIAFTSNNMNFAVRLGAASPEGAIDGVVGDIYIRKTSNGGIWIKTTDGTVNTGWLNLSVQDRIIDGTDFVRVEGTGDNRRVAITTSSQGFSLRAGTAAPEGNITGLLGDLYIRKIANGGLWIKTTEGSTNTGWLNLSVRDRIASGSDSIVLNDTNNRVERTINGVTTYETFSTSNPEGTITAPVGSLHTNTSNGTLWRKTSGTGNTGWSNLAEPPSVDLTTFSGLPGGSTSINSSAWTNTGIFTNITENGRYLFLANISMANFSNSHIRARIFNQTNNVAVSRDTTIGIAALGHSATLVGVAAISGASASSPRTIRVQARVNGFAGGGTIQNSQSVIFAIRIG